MKVRAMFREIFLEMGFEEMATQQFVESSFWNFDALFQPQQHPARDAHDTFFLKCDPPRSTFHLRPHCALPRFIAGRVCAECPHRPLESLRTTWHA